MLRRARWFSIGVVAGAAAGAGTTMYSFVRWRESRSRLAPDQLSETVVGAARVVGRGAQQVGQQVGRGAQRTGAHVAGAVRDGMAEGRQAMAEASAQIDQDLARPPSSLRYPPDGPPA